MVYISQGPCEDRVGHCCTAPRMVPGLQNVLEMCVLLLVPLQRADGR